MLKISCPQCGVRLTAPEELIGKPVNCQKCEAVFILSKRWMPEPLNKLAHLSERPNQSVAGGESSPDAPLDQTKFGSNVSTDQPDVLYLSDSSASNSSGGLTDSLKQNGLETTGHRPELPSEHTPNQSATGSDETRKSSRQPTQALVSGVTSSEIDPISVPWTESTNKIHCSTAILGRFDETYSLLALLDFRFRYFLTPTIVRLSWFLVIVLVTFWVLLMSYFYVSSVLNRSAPIFPRIDSTGTSEANVKIDSDSNINPIPPFFFQTGVYFSLILGTFLGLLWLRVILETVMMVFSIGGYLRERTNTNRRR